MKKTHWWRELFNLPDTTQKLIRIMKLTILMMGIFSVNILASVYSQETHLDIDVKNESVRNVLKTIENESEFRFFYNDEFSDLNKKVTINLSNRKLEDILSEMLKNTEVSYKIMENNFVVLTPKKLLQQQRVTGKIIESGTGEPLAGVTVQVKGTMTGTISGADGNYSVNITEGATTLIFSFVGFASQEIEVAGRNVIDIEMSEEITSLEEVIVIGYGTQKKSDLTGSVVRVGEDVISERPGISVIQSLQGASAGLNIGQINQAGEEPDIQVRGQTSLSGTSNPLIVLDGIIFRGNLIDINPNDIKSIDVLKDASSTAIY